MSWRIELTREAASTLRGLPREQQEVIALRINILEWAGLPDSAEPLPGIEAVRAIHAGQSRLLCAARYEECAILIVKIEPIGASPYRTLVRALNHSLRGLRGRKSHVGTRRWGWLSDLTQDFMYSFRTLRRSPGFAIAAVWILALGIGANAALFSVVNNVFLRALPFREGDRVVRIRNHTLGPAGEQRRFNVSPIYFYAIRERNEVFEEVGAALVQSYSLTGEADPERVRGVSVSENWAPMLGIRPALGRYFAPEEEQQGHDSGAALLSHGLWLRSFGGEPDVLGSSIVLDGRTFAVIGVMPPRFNFPYDADVWLPGHFDRNDARSHSYNILARLRAGVSVEQAQANLDRIADSVSADRSGSESVGLSVVSARDNFVRSDEEDRVILALLAAVGFLLLIACVNVANLLLARFTLREREISIRAALGAGSGRQLRQFLTETLVLFLVGGLIGLLLTWWSRGYLVVLVPSVLSEQLALGELEVGGRVMTFTLLVSFATGLVFGMLAAWRAARPDTSSVSRLGARGVAGGRHSMQRALIVAEVALALVLLTGAGLMIQNFQRLRSRELGFSAQGLLTFRLELGAERYANSESRAQAMTEILRKTAGVPGVLRTGTTSDNPICCGNWGAILQIEGLERAIDAPPIAAFHRYVTPGFFETMGIPLLRGRVFTERDDARAVPAVVVDERMAEHFWPGEDPIGKRVRNLRGVEAQWRTVIGVVGAVHDMGDYQDTWYLPFYAEPVARATENVHFMARLSVEPDEVVPGIRRAIREVDPNLAIFEMEMMDELYDRAISQDRLGAVIAGLFGGFGLLLAASGIYGVMSFVVGQRRQEIGTRIALGAQRHDVVRLILGQSLGVVIVGAGIGLIGAVALNRVLASLIVDLGPLDTLLLSALTATLIVVAAAATLLPARRASRVDPVRAFRV